MYIYFSFCFIWFNFVIFPKLHNLISLSTFSMNIYVKICFIGTDLLAGLNF